ncbi:L-threonylcarbamoyladenylate synthase [Mesomycoplasma lagogenitalium]|uniref:L-threonylcarbamoyladenylate synthase n=1 Tax=Mesomycoplasma lagogenitalium TaxID=171286 RepID=A0ABY8LWV7_9BACT|nr:Sua5/YciO/YrdC/YwlC family protein [Mesomycoplasma lagogenitalium]WGI36798.1 Sua5/YciO/YrdC/YwlC family protein [Mesomycoplasma lagogenitalium]
MEKEKDLNDVFITTTDTVVGIGVPVNSNNVEILYKLKNRNLSKKIIILVSSIEQARTFKQWNIDAEKMAHKYWPGATTLVVNDQGFRMPDQSGLLQLLEKLGPCYVTSANISGKQTLNLQEAQKTFFMIKKVYDFGEGTNKPSKIIRVENMEEIR